MQHVTDPTFAGDVSVHLCRRVRSSARRRRSTCAARRPGRSRPGKGDTVWLGAIDANGLAVSYIQSIFWEFGSGVRAAEDRHHLAEPRLQLLARSEGASIRSNPAASRSTRSTRRWPASTMAAS